MISPPKILRGIYKNALWTVPNSKNEVYLTFDDGPHLRITEDLLNVLGEHKAKATFFLLGKNALAYPDLVSQFIKKGHAIGNHSFSHLNGLNCSLQDYLEDIGKCESVIQSNLFRPPYGKMKPSQNRSLSKKYTVVMWDILSKDYSGISAEKCFQNIKKRIRPGSIIVFHENDKSENIVIPVVKKLLGYLDQKNWVSKTLS